MSSDITVVIATIPIRAKLLRWALASVVLQTFQPAAIVVEYDHERTGAAATRNRALAAVQSPWTAFLDDDDVMLPQHLEKLREAQMDTGADVVYPWPEMVGAGDPRPDRFGVPFDADELRRGSYIPVTSLVRTDLAQQAGFHRPPGSDYDDWGFYCSLLDLGAKFHHLPERTWLWHVEGQNTSGRPDRW